MFGRLYRSYHPLSKVHGGQPRVPAGSSAGGQFAPKGGGSGGGAGGGAAAGGGDKDLKAGMRELTGMFGDMYSDDGYDASPSDRAAMRDIMGSHPAGEKAARRIGKSMDNDSPSTPADRKKAVKAIRAWMEDEIHDGGASYIRHAARAASSMMSKASKKYPDMKGSSKIFDKLAKRAEAAYRRDNE